MNVCERNMHQTIGKTGTITQIPKLSSVSTDPGDWRPASVLPLPNKILEKIVYNQLLYYFESNGLLFKINKDSEKE